MRDARHPLGAEEKNSYSRGPAIPILIEKHMRQYRSPEDGTRLLVMRYWPRGVRRAAVQPAVAPLALLLADCSCSVSPPQLAPGCWR